MRSEVDARLANALASHNASLREVRSVRAPSQPKPEPKRLPRVSEPPKDKPWSLDLSPEQAGKIQRDNPYLWHQLIDRGFIEADGSDSERWKVDPRNTGMK